jgi:hypothetical protein
MTFEQIFAGRMTLMRAQRHIAQASVLRYEQELKGANWLKPIFRDQAGEQAFFIVELRLIALEREFDIKTMKRSARQRRCLNQRADRQVRRSQ